MPVQYERPNPDHDPAQREDDPDTPAQQSLLHHPAMKVLAVFVVLVVLALLVHACQGGTTAKPKTRKPSGQSGVTVLPKGTVTPGKGGKRTLPGSGGLEVGYPHTTDGAAAAGVNYLTWFSSEQHTVSRDRVTGLDYLGDQHVSRAAAAQMVRMFRSAPGVNARGLYLGRSGRVNTSMKYYSLLLPRYGAYRVVSSTSSKATVELWAPWIHGVSKADGSGAPLKVDWIWTQVTLAWKHGDWRLITNPKDMPHSPVPSPKQFVNASFVSRARILPAGQGWRMTADATQDTSAVPPQVPLKRERSR